MKFSCLLNLYVWLNIQNNIESGPRGLIEIPTHATQEQSLDLTGSGNLPLDFIGTRKPSYGWDVLGDDPALLDTWISWNWTPMECPDATTDDLLAAKNLRETMTRMIGAFLMAQPYASDDCTLLNTWAAKPRPVPHLGRDGITWHGSGVSDFLAEISCQAIDLLFKAKPEQIRKCAAPQCDQLFYDNSRSQRRRWCDMETCGNRSKVNAFNRRNRGESS